MQFASIAKGADALIAAAASKDSPAAAASGGQKSAVELAKIAKRASAAERDLRKLVDDTLGYARGRLTPSSNSSAGAAGDGKPSSSSSSAAAGEGRAGGPLIPKASVEALTRLCGEFASVAVAAASHGIAPEPRSDSSSNGGSGGGGGNTKQQQKAAKGADGEAAAAAAHNEPPPPYLTPAYFLDRAVLFSCGPSGEVGALSPLPPGHCAFSWPHPPHKAFLLRKVQELCAAAQHSPEFAEEWAAEVGALGHAAATAAAAMQAAAAASGGAMTINGALTLNRMMAAAASATNSVLAQHGIMGATLSNGTLGGTGLMVTGATISGGGAAADAFGRSASPVGLLMNGTVGGGGGGRVTPQLQLQLASTAGGSGPSSPISAYGGAGSGATASGSWYSERSYASGHPLPYASFVALLQHEPAVAQAFESIAAAAAAAASDAGADGSTGSSGPPAVLSLGCGLGSFNFYAAASYGVKLVARFMRFSCI